MDNNNNKANSIYAGEETGTPVPAQWLGAITLIVSACVILTLIALIIMYGG